VQQNFPASPDEMVTTISRPEKNSIVLHIVKHLIGPL